MSMITEIKLKSMSAKDRSMLRRQCAENGDIESLLTIAKYNFSHGSAATNGTTLPELCYYSGRLRRAGELEEFLEKNTFDVMTLSGSRRELAQNLLAIGHKFPDLSEIEIKYLEYNYCNSEAFERVDILKFDSSLFSRSVKRLKKFILPTKFALINLIIFYFFATSFTPELKSNLYEVDRQIEQKTHYEQDKLKRIEQLKFQLENTAGVKTEYDTYSKLFHEYEAYQYDSAYCYIKKMVNLAPSLNEQKKKESKLLMAYCCLSSGLFLESLEIANAIDTTAFNDEYKIIVYDFFTKFYLDMAQSIGVEPYYSDYLEKSISYNKKIIQKLGIDNPRSKPYIVNIYRCRHRYAEAIASIQDQIQDKNMPNRIQTLNIGGLGYFYLMKGDTTQAIPYLCQAAINDIKSVNKESPALRMLASILYEQGDIERAYTYAKLALDDAQSFNARQRKIEVGDVLPIIEDTRFNIINDQKSKLLNYAILVTVLCLLILTAALVILKQIQKLRNARKFIEKQNFDLQMINRQLMETSHIKEAYIGNFFSNNSAYIDKIEGIYKLVNRKIASRQYDDLSLMFKNTEIVKERNRLYASFDQTFLKLFPDFVNQYNLLFNERDRIQWGFGEDLCPELRIFALFRLGVTNNSQIAKFLNYSVNTIHTYKTKAKNRSFINNELFEEEIMKIETIMN